MVCRMPLGLPVEPDVYRMNSGCSLSKGSGGTDAGGVHRQLVPPVVTTVRPVDLEARPAIDDHVLERRAQGGGSVSVLFQGHDVAPAIPAVRGDQDLGLAVLHPPGQSLGAEAAEDHHVRAPIASRPGRR